MQVAKEAVPNAAASEIAGLPLVAQRTLISHFFDAISFERFADMFPVLIQISWLMQRAEWTGGEHGCGQDPGRRFQTM